GHGHDFGEHVFGQGDDHRAGTAGGGHVEGARDQFGNALDLIDFGDPFGLGAEYRAIVHFLEGFALAHAAFDLAHEEDHGGGVLAGDVHTGHGVGGTGAAGDHADARGAREFAVRVGHHGGAAFLATDRDLDLMIVQAVEHGQVAFARHTEHMAHAMRGELVDQNMTSHSSWWRVGS